VAKYSATFRKVLRLMLYLSYKRLSFLPSRNYRMASSTASVVVMTPTPANFSKAAMSRESPALFFR